MILLFFLFSFVAGMLGIGGGVVYTPLQVFLGSSFHEAATISLFLIAFTSLGATLIYHKSKMIDVKMVLFLETFTATGSFMAGYLASWISEDVIRVLFFLLLFSVGFYNVLTAGKVGERLEKPTRFEFLYWRRTFAGREYYLNIPVAVVFSVLAGAISGLLGVGGGVIKLPLMVNVLHVPLKVAIASSAMMVGITAAFGFLGRYVGSSEINWSFLLVLGVFVFIGSRLGARFSVKRSDKTLKRIFGIVLMLVSFAILLV